MLVSHRYRRAWIGKQGLRVIFTAPANAITGITFWYFHLFLPVFVSSFHFFPFHFPGKSVSFPEMRIFSDCRNVTFLLIIIRCDNLPFLHICFSHFVSPSFFVHTGGKNSYFIRNSLVSLLPPLLHPISIFLNLCIQVSFSTWFYYVYQGKFKLLRMEFSD